MKLASIAVETIATLIYLEIREQRHQVAPLTESCSGMCSYFAGELRMSHLFALISIYMNYYLC